MLKLKALAPTHQIHTAHSVQSIAESRRRPGPPTLLTTSNVALELNSVNGASVTPVQLPGMLYLAALSLPLTLIDLKSFKNSSIPSRVLTSVSTLDNL